MNAFFKFIASPAGRLVRILAGIVLIAWGYLSLAGTTGLIVIVIGLVPLLAGVFDVCVFAPLFRLPFGGSALRIKVK